MKYLIIILVFTFLFNNLAAQCPGCIAVNCVNPIGGGGCDTVILAMESHPVDKDISFVFPTRLSLIIPPIPGVDTIDKVQITGLTGLPNGLDWETDRSGTGNQYYPSSGDSVGCFKICGTPVSPVPQIDTFPLTMDVVVEVNTPFGPFSQPLSFTYVKIVLSPDTGMTTPSWSVNPTSENHTIILSPANLTTNINGSPLAIGDYIGVFYDSGGAMLTSGFIEWQGTVNSIVAYGNDLSPPSKNGFNVGEKFNFKVWQAASKQEFTVQVSYLPVGSISGLITDTDIYANDGISGLATLHTCITQDIQINNGWNLISSYIRPQNPDITDIFSQISDDIFIIKNSLGHVVIPFIGLNNIGSWEITQGYKVKASTNTTLTIGCEQIDPTITPVLLQAGWSIIPYLRNLPMNVETALNTVGSNIFIVKNGNGDSYIPSLGVNGIGNMVSGQGFKIKMAVSDTLYYPSN